MTTEVLLLIGFGAWILYALIVLRIARKKRRKDELAIINFYSMTDEDVKQRLIGVDETYKREES